MTIRSEMGRLTGWDRLSLIGNSRLVKTSYLWLILVPIVARMFEGLPDPLVIYIQSKEIPIPTTLPFRWQLFYYMSFCFALGQIIYAIYCPPLVANFRTYGDYLQSHAGYSGIDLLLREMISDIEKVSRPKKSSDYNGSDEFSWILEHDGLKHWAQILERARHAIPKSADVIATNVVISFLISQNEDKFKPIKEYLIGKSKDMRRVSSEFGRAPTINIHGNYVELDDIVSAKSVTGFINHFSEDDRFMSDLFDFVRSYESSKHFIARGFSGLFILFGFIFFTVIAMQSFLTVWHQTLA